MCSDLHTRCTPSFFWIHTGGSEPADSWDLGTRFVVGRSYGVVDAKGQKEGVAEIIT